MKINRQQIKAYVSVQFSGTTSDAYGTVMFNAKGEVLLREPSGHFGGYAWTFAKGRPDEGETPAQTAIRETFEETGYRVTCPPGLPHL